MQGKTLQHITGSYGESATYSGELRGVCNKLSQACCKYRHNVAPLTAQPNCKDSIGGKVWLWTARPDSQVANAGPRLALVQLLMAGPRKVSCRVHPTP